MGLGERGDIDGIRTGVGFLWIRK